MEPVAPAPPEAGAATPIQGEGVADLDHFVLWLRAAASKLRPTTAAKVAIRTTLLALVEPWQLGAMTVDMVDERMSRWIVTEEADMAVPSRQAMIVKLSNWFLEHMMPNDAFSMIRVSTIPGAGYGLFATRAIEPEQNITLYGGDLFESPEEFAEVRGETVAESRSQYIIASAPPATRLIDGRLGYHLYEQGRWANTQPREDLCNAEFRWHETEPEVWMVATRPIGAGDEIFVWYSAEYAEELFGGSPGGGKRARVEQCIQCLGREVRWQFQHDPRLLFCSRDCATLFWNGTQ